ncbi:hypothetical protein DFP72DRAFT_842964 [Ephemerocybe angulata]|uniref:Uncharacterized protein n=1 Tax=Ephemerocybe angulata TaxID=980116 RepID=A0A8H6IBU8_9AGAR|nr:hypothetical protein DFP72DRAFT_842964 [Tulosesus angulatus]
MTCLLRSLLTVNVKVRETSGGVQEAISTIFAQKCMGEDVPALVDCLRNPPQQAKHTPASRKRNGVRCGTASHKKHLFDLPIISQYSPALSCSFVLVHETQAPMEELAEEGEAKHVSALRECCSDLPHRAGRSGAKNHP